MENKNLKREVEDLKEKLRTVLEKVDKYKRCADNYAVVVELIESQKTDTSVDASSLINSTHPVCLDLKYPQITINMAQKNALSQISNPGAATRALMDMLFEQEAYRGKNFSLMEKSHPDHIKAIRNYVTERFKIDSAKISKTITNKCKGY